MCVCDCVCVCVCVCACVSDLSDVCGAGRLVVVDLSDPLLAKVLSLLALLVQKYKY